VYSSRYRSRKQLIDDRSFEFGDVYTICDECITFPDSDALDKRDFHYRRWIVIASNNSENYNELCPIVSVIPLSHRTDLVRTNDIILEAEVDGVEQDCIAMTRLIQPVLKVDLGDCMGKLRLEKKQELLVAIETYFGCSVDENQED